MKMAILGFGIMGSIMSESVLRAGYDLVVCNRTIEKTKLFADKGASVANTPAQAISMADVSIIVVMGGDAIKEIMLSPDVLAAVKNKTIICASSCKVDEMMSVLQRLRWVLLLQTIVWRICISSWAVLPKTKHFWWKLYPRCVKRFSVSARSDISQSLAVLAVWAT